MSRITVVICTRRRPVLLRRCLAAVALLKPGPTKVIVVDNSKGDKDTERVAREFGASYVIEPKPGLNRARSRGLAECETENAAFLEDDAIPAPDWISTLAAAPALQATVAPTGKILNFESRLVRKIPRKDSADPE